MAPTIRDAAPSAVVVPIRLPPAITALRDRWDRAAASGAGPHVTILYPFLPAGVLDAATRSVLADIARAIDPFEVRFATTRRTGGLVWLDATPSAPFVALTSSVVARWPDWPPYAGAFDQVVPHCTVVESGAAPLATIEATVLAALPIVTAVGRLEVWQQDAGGRWRTRWRLPLGVRP
jgi:hypothetical protein